MAFNGSGTFVRLYDWTTDESNSINIEASRMDGEDDGFATGLSTCITKDGQTTITANIPFNSKKITGLANGSARTDSIALGQVQDGTYTTMGTLGGSADTYTASPSPAITAYATGMEFNMKVNADNTGASTLNISTVGAKDVKKYDGEGAKVALEAGDLQQDQYYKVIYDGTDMVVLNPQAPYLDTSNFANPNFNPNLAINGQAMIFEVSPITSTSTPKNDDDTIICPGIRLLSDGNDIADVSQETSTVPTGSYSAIKLDQETANKQWGIVQVLNSQDSAALIDGTASLSFKARKGGSNTTLETLRAGIIAWSGTADSVTTDVVATWNGAGTDPSLATNWTYENTPSNLTLTTSFQEFKVENVSVDTSSTTNVALFIWLDDTDATVTDTAFITDIKIEEGTSSTDFKAHNLADVYATVGNTQRGGVVTGGDRILEIETASSSATLEFTNLDSSFSAYEFQFVNILPATDGAFLTAQISTDNGSTWINTNYLQRVTWASTNDAAASVTGKTSGITVGGKDTDGNTGAGNNATKGGLNGRFILYNPGNASAYSQLMWQVVYRENTAFDHLCFCDGIGTYQGATTAVNGIQFIYKQVNSDTNSGNVASGKIIMRGIV